MLACDESASIFWARVMRGTSSMASDVTLPATSAFTMGTFLWGEKNEIATAPGFIAAASSLPSLGLDMSGATLRIRSAWLHSAGAPMRAPASLKRSSPRYAWSPAPDSTATSRPSLTSRLTVSVVAATRVSPAATSVGTQTFNIGGYYHEGPRTER